MMGRISLIPLLLNLRTHKQESRPTGESAARLQSAKKDPRTHAASRGDLPEVGLHVESTPPAISCQLGHGLHYVTGHSHRIVSPVMKLYLQQCGCQTETKQRAVCVTEFIT